MGIEVSDVPSDCVSLGCWLELLLDGESEMKTALKVEHDKTTRKIGSLLERIPKIGKYLAGIYFRKPMMFNFMLVGASGTILSYLLYEGIFRRLLIEIWGGAFLGMVITTILVFLWNFTWNRKWSLNSGAQILQMKKSELLELDSRIQILLREKFDYLGDRRS